MPRSDYVYVVLDVLGVTKIKGTFTVKHELVGWLRQKTEAELIGLQVYRCLDCWKTDNSATRMDLEELLNG